MEPPVKYEIANVTGSIGVSQVSPVSSVSSSSSSCMSSEANAKLTVQIDKKENQPKHKCSSFSPSGFHKVLNKLVETGMNVTKSKQQGGHQTSESNESGRPKEDTKYELINGYEEPIQHKQEQQQVEHQKQQKKQRSSSYKSNSLTRLGRQQLFKINESVQDLSESCNKQTPTGAGDATTPAAKPDRKNHSSLPSRNFKMVDDIRSLFDKLTSSKQQQQQQRQRPTSTSVFYSESLPDQVSSIPNGLSKVEATKLKLSQSFQANASPNKALKSNSAANLPPIPPESSRQVTTLKSVDEQLSRPESPRKGSLKKKGLNACRDSTSLTRSPLKVRWKDMIEISNSVIQSDSDTNSSDCEQFFSDLLNDAEMASISRNAPAPTAMFLQEEQSFHKDIIVTSIEKKATGSTEHKFNLKPLHATGKEFEKEMSDRIARLNRIKIKGPLLEEDETDRFYDDVHADLDVVLYELHSTIEHVRLSSMLDAFEETKEGFNGEGPELSGSNHAKFEEKIADVAVICRQFVNNSKSMISSALVDEEGVRPHVRSAMNSLCSLVVECLETNYKYLYLNKKLDETRQLLIQILNLLNTFRTTLNITYLASSKQLNESNVNLLMKQATNLANEISMLIKQFKQLF